MICIYSSREYGEPQSPILNPIFQSIIRSLPDRIYAHFSVNTGLNKANCQKALSHHKDVLL